MLKQTIKFTDYNGNEREIIEFFHLNEAEIVKLQARSPDGIQAEMQDAILSNDASRVLDFIEGLVHLSYGKKSQDGINFDKSPEILNKFITSAYYSDFLLGLIEDNGRKGEAFVQGIMPAKLVERALAQVQGQPGGPVDRQVYAPDAREQFAQAQAANSVRTEIVPDPQSPVDRALTNAFGQPEYPRLQPQTQAPEPAPQPTPQYPAPLNTQEEAEFLAWKANKDAEAARLATTAAGEAAPASPDNFRVPVTQEEQPMQGLPRPPHEQFG